MRRSTLLKFQKKMFYKTGYYSQAWWIIALEELKQHTYHFPKKISLR
jgi:hypothetical protein